MVKATQKEHAQPDIVTALDTIPTVSHLDKSKTIIVYDFRNQLAIVALKSCCRTLTLSMNSDLCQ